MSFCCDAACTPKKEAQRRALGYSMWGGSRRTVRGMSCPANRSRNRCQRFIKRQVFGGFAVLLIQFGASAGENSAQLVTRYSPSRGSILQLRHCTKYRTVPHVEGKGREGRRARTVQSMPGKARTALGRPFPSKRSIEKVAVRNQTPRAPEGKGKEEKKIVLKQHPPTKRFA